METRKYRKGEVIFKEGDIGHYMYEILGGSVEIVAEKGTEFEKKLTDLKKGDIFGEMALIEDYPRSATAIALEDTEVEQIRGSEVGEYFEKKPEKILEIMRHISARTRTLTDDYMAVCRAINDSDGSRGSVQKKDGLWKKLKAFAGIYTRRGYAIPREGDEQKLEHVEGLGKNVVTCKKGQIIFKEGDNSGCMYDILAGQVNIYASYGKPDEKLLVTLDRDQFFGEMGIIENDLRSATAVSNDYSTYIEIIYPADLGTLFQANPAKVLMILQHLSSRLRRLTIDYLTACKTASDIVDAEEKGGNLTSEAEDRVKMFCAISVYGRYYT